MTTRYSRPAGDHSGFTLIELVVVITLLGVLAAFAIPRFASLGTEAQVASLRSMEGAVRSGTALVYSTALVQGRTDPIDTVDLSGRTVRTRYGYPRGQFTTAMRYVLNLDPFSGNPSGTPCPEDWCASGGRSSVPTDGGSLSTTGEALGIYPRGYTLGDLCSVYYINDEDGTRPRIGVSTTGC